MPPFSSLAMTNNDGEGEAVKAASCRSVRCRRWYRDKTNYYPSMVLLGRKRKSDALCQQGDISEGAQNTMPGFDFDRLPEDILCHIHSLIPLRDAARLACLSHRFLRSWRCFPNLTFNQETFSLNVFEGTSYERGKKLVDTIDNILQNHSGTGVKTLKIRRSSRAGCQEPCTEAGEYDLAWKDPDLEDSNADSLQIRRIPEFRHANLKNVSINRFFPSKSLIELTYLIIENASSLQCLKLDTGYGFDTNGMCKWMNKLDVIQALSAVEVAKRYIEGKVPSSVKFSVLEPCKRCHIPKLSQL